MRTLARGIALTLGLAAITVQLSTAAPSQQTAARHANTHAHSPWHFKHGTPKLTMYRIIARHDRWVISTRKTHPTYLNNFHRRELRHARKHINKILAAQRAAVWHNYWPWTAIVDCESGDGTGTPPYTADWGYNYDFEGGPNFTHDTWVTYGGLAYAPSADQATPQHQIMIAEKVLADVGWGAWPDCSSRIGLR